MSVVSEQTMHTEPLGHRGALATGPQLAFVEDVALYFEQRGPMPRMCGRIVGYLLICDPPEQTAAQLASVLQASRGSISTATRQLVSAGLVQRVVKPGERRDYFRIDDEGWGATVLRALAELTSFLDILQRGRHLMAGAPPEQRARLENVTDLYEWMRDELRPVLERHETERRARRRD